MKRGSIRFSYALLSVSIFLWASAFPGIRFMLRTFDPMPFTSLRLAVTMLTLGTFGVLLRIPLPKKEDLPRIIITGCFGYSGYHTSLNLGLDHVTAGQGSFIIATIPLWTSILAWRFLGETMTRFHVIGTIVSLCGVGVLTLTDTEFEVKALFFVLASVFAAANMTMQKSLLEKYPPTHLVVYVTVVGCLPIVLFGGGVDIAPALNATQWAVLLYLGMIPIGFGYWLITIVLKTLPAIRTSQGILFVPPIVSTLAWLILDEVPEGHLFSGGALVVIGVAISMRKSKKLNQNEDDSQ